MELLKVLGDIQNGGGLMLVVFYVVIELRYLRRDVNKHDKILFPEK